MALNYEIKQLNNENINISMIFFLGNKYKKEYHTITWKTYDNEYKNDMANNIKWFQINWPLFEKKMTCGI